MRQVSEQRSRFGVGKGGWFACRVHLMDRFWRRAVVGGRLRGHDENGKDIDADVTKNGTANFLLPVREKVARSAG